MEPNPLNAHVLWALSVLFSRFVSLDFSRSESSISVEMAWFLARQPDSLADRRISGANTRILRRSAEAGFLPGVRGIPRVF